MRNILILIFAIVGFSVYAQSFEETQQWIINNASAKNYTTVNQQVFYSESKKLMYFIKVLEYPSGGHTFISFVFDPKKASSISIDKHKDSDGGHNLTLWFSESTKVHSVSIPDTSPYTGTRLSNDFIERLDVKEGSEKRGAEIYLSCGMEQIVSVKNAYIHLFKKLGYTIKDADKMF
jgi:hypothetical protein